MKHLLSILGMLCIWTPMAIGETCVIPYAGYIYGDSAEENSSNLYRTDICQPEDTDYVDPTFSLAKEPVVEGDKVVTQAQPPGWKDIQNAYNRGHLCVCSGATDNDPPIDSKSLPEDGRAALGMMITQAAPTCGKFRTVVDGSGKIQFFCDDTIKVYNTQTGAQLDHPINYAHYWLIPPKNDPKEKPIVDIKKRINCAAQNGKPLNGPALLKYKDPQGNWKRYEVPGANANRVSCVNAGLPPFTPRVSQLLVWIPFDGAPVYQPTSPRR